MVGLVINTNVSNYSIKSHSIQKHKNHVNWLARLWFQYILPKRMNSSEILLIDTKRKTYLFGSEQKEIILWTILNGLTDKHLIIAIGPVVSQQTQQILNHTFLFIMMALGVHPANGRMVCGKLVFSYVKVIHLMSKCLNKHQFIISKNFLTIL